MLYQKKCVSLQSLSTVKKAVSKKSIAELSFQPNFAKVQIRRTEHLCFRLYVYAIYPAYLQA
jgi:hypothetical protein